MKSYYSIRVFKTEWIFVMDGRSSGSGLTHCWPSWAKSSLVGHWSIFVPLTREFQICCGFMNCISIWVQWVWGARWNISDLERIHILEWKCASSGHVPHHKPNRVYTASWRRQPQCVILNKLRRRPAQLRSNRLHVTSVRVLFKLLGKSYVYTSWKDMWKNKKGNVAYFLLKEAQQLCPTRFNVHKDVGRSDAVHNHGRVLSLHVHNSSYNIRQNRRMLLPVPGFLISFEKSFQGT